MNLKYIFVFIVILIIILGYMLKQAYENHIKFHTVKTNGANQSISLFFISDTHNRKISSRLLKKVAGKVDYVIIGGDFADQRTSFKKIESNLKDLTSIAPTFFVWGNNDREIGEKEMVTLLNKYSVKILWDDSALLNEQHNPIRLCGIDFNDNGNNIEKSIAHCRVDENVIFIAHNPESFSTLLNQTKPILMMGGHFHGGQIRMGKYSIHPKGSFKEVHGVPTLISNGYGTTLLPLRFGAKPETHIITIQFQQ